MIGVKSLTEFTMVSILQELKNLTQASELLLVSG